MVLDMVARLTPEERAELDALMTRQAEGDVDPALMGKIYMTLWPSYSYVHGNVLPPTSLRLELPLEGQPDTLASIAAHFEAGTLEHGLPSLDLPALLLHGEGDPMPISATRATAALIRGSEVKIVERAGYFPWLERRGEFGPFVAKFLAEHGGPALVDPSPDSDPLED
jgi:pimeloyl-ACP methyl ester carboxylesterase